MKLPYTIVILWSDEDHCYLVHLPEFSTQQFHTHGETYEEALKNAQEVLELLIEDYEADGKTLPIPKMIEQTFQLA
ncbi:type II toxin-antitoxin system HicB family antitoxin [Planktothrix sp. FACHB-1365]|uniref:type II toxin-antitoxin system HicB family antitoxin n=1 Tax=Planktothrix sp. FACHB-1365 TaxID=2692855 RepID=UPI00168A3D12|nr:type II toxin-antitoxin system HicB family antitoxin [Planktothrix sp. FACHB-1365]MBD2484969.1 type II toxin-antitoxin system HicB family antitoxin [Planktothrix sp. FACHB-1365]